MGLFRQNKHKETVEKGSPTNTTPTDTPARGNSHVATNADLEPHGRVPAIAVILGAVASIGGFMFGKLRGVTCRN